jgi:Tfp pilus assembly PilM family ATPase
MSQSIGIHLGERGFRLLALEGSLKRHKVACSAAESFTPGEGAAEAVVERLRELAKEHKLRGETVHLVIDSGVAAFRTLTLPFDDREKIEEVIKFEIEGNLPQYDIDQVVVDFQVLASKPGVESSLLVTAVPKERLRAALQLCERAGLEPLEAELEGTALFDAAYEGGLLADDAGTVLIHVGDSSTTVVVADGRRLASVRSIRVGAQLRGEGEPAEEGAEAKAAETKSPEAPEDNAARLAASAQRIRREIARTLSGARTAQEIKRVYVCGQELSGLEGETLLDVAVEPLPLALEGLATGAREYAVAFGAALRGFEGGTLAPRLRREELRFSGRFERLELPLAVLTLLLFTFLFVKYIVRDKQLDWRDEGNLAAEVPAKGDMQIWLEASNQRIFPDPTDTRPVRLPNAPPALLAYARKAEAGEDLERTKYEELLEIRRQLKLEIDRLSKELGQVSEIEQPQSALSAATLVMNVIGSMGEGLRMGIRRFEANYQHSVANKDDFVTVVLDADFFGENSLEATRSYNQLESQFESQPWCVEFDGKSTKSLEGDKGIQVDGLTIRVDVDRSPLGGKQQQP